MAYGKDHGKDLDEKVDATLDNLLVQFGSEILKIVPGKVSTEVDARFSFDKQGSIEKALHIIEVRRRPSFAGTLQRMCADHPAALQRHGYRQVSRLD